MYYQTRHYSRWLMYWLLYACITVIECMADLFLFSFQLYHTCKVRSSSKFYSNLTVALLSGCFSDLVLSSHEEKWFFSDFQVSSQEIFSKRWRSSSKFFGRPWDGKFISEKNFWYGDHPSWRTIIQLRPMILTQIYLVC